LFLSISEFIGHFHPVLVHLPIGILLLSSVLYWFARRSASADMMKAVNISLLIGMIAAIASCISGFLLSESDDYDTTLVGWHQWMGISVALISVVWYFMNKKSFSGSVQWRMSAALFVFIIITGHLGGSLTHGSDYLTKALGSASSETVVKRKAVPNVQEALAYTDIIQPMLQSKCYSCHGAEKQKGKLRLDEPEFIMKGGKNGEAIRAGAAEQGELMKRLLLPREHDDHMPPKEKSQLSENELALIHWWIASGASFDKKVKDLQQPEKMKPVLLALQSDEASSETIPEIPATPVEKASDSAVAALRKKGVVVLAVSSKSNYLMANFVTATAVTDKDLALLLPVKKQLVSLKLGNSKISDSAMEFISQCTSVLKLQLNNTRITDKGVAMLRSLKELKYLNLVATPVTAAGVLQLKELKNLQAVYLYQTGVKSQDWETLQKNFPASHIDSGGYIVPTLESDTSELKLKKKTK
jgi:uncharacterized membrane protein/mono/diheme cytochrome c family protein